MTSLHIVIKIFFYFRSGSKWHPPKHSEIFGSAVMSCQTDELVTVQAYQKRYCDVKTAARRFPGSLITVAGR